ncbi:Ankyrin repeat and EF-hand domain-containing protein 1 [Madurella mycetomatis]|uniref:Ankyrin repeat and EF-hand domain-containing protein 1 n=1 Tax=Madurella mycetomatis TaxID=100816 RepID=A0A175VSU2_9PEZI|nr:Ankyrin repeat and EF-hand domain-containing protein 1 [Madurella mycetomatis]KXX74221.1 Ankyrin repeat and EF-hand domain-containing protein 1 [Madurella mycetomatis]
MPSIHDLAQKGTLTKAELRRQIESRPESINEPNSEGIPPLTLAAGRGHLSIVDLLLREKADANQKDRNGRTALNVAAQHAGDNQAAIIRALLRGGAEVDATCPALKNNTPLMTVIIQTSDLDSIAELVDKKASLTAKNMSGQTAGDLAKGKDKVIAALQQNSTRKGIFAKAVGRITRTVGRVLTIFNEPLQTGIRFLTKALGFTPQWLSRQRIATPVISPEDIPRTSGPTPETSEAKKEREVKEELAKIADDIKKSKMNKFTGLNDDFLETLAAKTVALRQDVSTLLGSPENLPDMINLAMYKPVVYCDDSGSMEGERYDVHQKSIVERISRITTKIVPDELGVDLWFINHPEGFTNLREERIRAVVEDVRPTFNGTRIGTNLEEKILKPLIYEPMKTGRLTRPFLISIITDGWPTLEDDDKLKNVIRKCKFELDKLKYPQHAVLFQISQVGDEPKADKFLKNLRDDSELEGMIYVTTNRLDSIYQDLRDNEKQLEIWLLKTLVAPIYRWGPDFIKRQHLERKKRE